jgi:hypothetical protein
LLEDSLAEGLARGTPDVLPASALRHQVEQDCATLECLQRAAKATDAQLLLRSKLGVRGPDHELRLELVDAGRGTILVDAARTCDLCGAEELRELAADLAATIGRKVSAVATARLKPVLLVDSRPPGATVQLDRVTVGTTPLQVEIEPGAHEVRVLKPGFVSRTHQLSFREGVHESLSVTLEREGPDRRLWMRGLGYGALAGGAAAAAAGIALVAIHDRPIRFDCAGDNRDADGDCRFVHKTLGGGIVLVTAGAAALAAGIALTVLGHRGAPRRPQAAFGPGWLGVRGRF